MSYHVYILQDAVGAYYVEYTSDVAARVLAHQTGRGGLHVKKLISPQLVYSEPQVTLEGLSCRSRGGVGQRSAP